VSPRGRVLGNVDAALADLGLPERRVRLTLPHVLAVPAVVAATDGIVTLASRIGDRLAVDYGLQAKQTGMLDDTTTHTPASTLDRSPPIHQAPSPAPNQPDSLYAIKS
jgi:hypothetical protein